MHTIASLYISLMPVILTGILTMAWCKTNWAMDLARPIDGGRLWRDGRPWFGAHKTWKGLIGYAVMGIVSGVFWGAVCGAVPALQAANLAYTTHANTLAYNAALGLAFGLAYAGFELPNSFAKRRFAIAPGAAGHGATKIAFVVADQIDSLIGCFLVLAFVAPVGPGLVVGGIVLGAGTHMAVNVLLYTCHLRDTLI